LLELFANVKCSTDLVGLCMISSADLNLERLPTVRSPISF